jgi:hypothetical protein
VLEGLDDTAAEQQLLTLLFCVFFLLEPLKLNRQERIFVRVMKIRHRVLQLSQHFGWGKEKSATKCVLISFYFSSLCTMSCNMSAHHHQKKKQSARGVFFLIKAKPYAWLFGGWCSHRFPLWTILFRHEKVENELKTSTRLTHGHQHCSFDSSETTMSNLNVRRAPFAMRRHVVDRKPAAVVDSSNGDISSPQTMPPVTSAEGACLDPQDTSPSTELTASRRLLEGTTS